MVILLDKAGRVLAVNSAWRTSAAQVIEGAHYWQSLTALIPQLAQIPLLCAGVAAVLAGFEEQYALEFTAELDAVPGTFKLRAVRIPEITPAKNTLPDQGCTLLSIDNISERSRAQALLAFHAQHDPLTELPNRVLFFERLQEFLDEAAPGRANVALLLVDLDHFKNINDTLGHPLGDVLLQQVAQRLVSCLRTGDITARLGGDEFAMILRNFSHPNDAGLVATKIMRALAPPFKLAESEVFVTASIGITVAPRDGEDLHELLRNADIAMYRAKDLGKNAFAFFTNDMNERLAQHQILTMALRTALERDEFRLVYQPLVEVHSGVVSGVEALLRWKHPDLGEVSPGVFIPIAEETGLIVPIGAWVLRTACQQIKLWQEAGLQKLKVSVNVSARQLRGSRFLPQLRRVLVETEIFPQSLELELTESMLAENPTELVVKLQQIKALGVRLSLDDFGTGYSSLSNLSRFPFDTLKIDQSFVRAIDVDNQNSQGNALVKTVISLGHTLGFSVLAEGVETDQQAQFLRTHGSDSMQGYLISKPLSARETAKFLSPAPYAANWRVPPPSSAPSAAPMRMDRPVLSPETSKAGSRSH